MSKYKNLSEIRFPKTPLKIAKKDDIRKHIVRASAYITYFLQESDGNYSVSDESKLAAIATSSVRPIEEDIEPSKYLIRCINELEDAIHKIDNLDEKHTNYKCELKSIKKAIEEQTSLESDIHH